jgi:hypothetical protein
VFVTQYYNIIITKWKIWQFNVGSGWLLSECKGAKYGNSMQEMVDFLMNARDHNITNMHFMLNQGEYFLTKNKFTLETLIYYTIKVIISFLIYGQSFCFFLKY